MSGVAPDARAHWNARYRDAPALVGPPSAWLLGQEPHLHPQPGERALDLACGLGRHALWLAERGYRVDALDVSDVAVEALAASARDRELPVAARRVDVLEEDALAPDRYAVVVVCSFLPRPLLPAIAASLAPGGLLVYETFTLAQRALGWGPRDDRFLLAPGELRDAFAGLELLAYEEGARAEGEAETARLLARRPSRSDLGDASTPSPDNDSLTRDIGPANASASLTSRSRTR